MNVTERVLLEVAEERTVGDMKWGYPQSVMFNLSNAMCVLGEEVGEVCKEVVEYEAAGNWHSRKLRRKNIRAELLQVASIAVNFIQHLDLRGEEEDGRDNG